MAELLCPKCQTAMASIERSGVTLERCTDCGGVFLDRGELERLETAEAPGLASSSGSAGPGAAAPGAPAPNPQALFGELLNLARQYRGGGRGGY